MRDRWTTLGTAKVKEDVKVVAMARSCHVTKMLVVPTIAKTTETTDEGHNTTLLRYSKLERQASLQERRYSPAWVDRHRDTELLSSSTVWRPPL